MKQSTKPFTNKYEEDYLQIKELPVQERPFEKALEYGLESLSDVELLALIIRSGVKSMNSLDVAQHVLKVDEQNPGLLGLCYTNKTELCKIPGIGAVKAMELLAVAELSKRIAKTRRRERMNVECAADIANLYMEELRHERREKLLAIFFDGKNQLIKDVVISIGTVNSSVASPREIYVEALREGAVSVVLMHNHPSGDPTPSLQDMEITEIIRKAGDYIGIKLLDHIIIGDCTYISFREQHLLD